MDLKSTQLKDTYGNLLTIGTTAGSPQTGTLENGDGEDITTLDVVGTITADGLTVDGGSGGVTFNGASDIVSVVQSSAGTPAYIHLDNTVEASGKLWRLGYTGGVAGTAGTNFGVYNETDSTNVLNINANGDISFYEDTGSTPKLVWDASDERLNLSGSDYQFGIQQGANQPWYHRGVSDGSYRLHLNGTGDILTLDSSGNVGIGVTPDSVLHIKDDTSTVYDGTAYQKDLLIERKNTSGNGQSAHLRFVVTGHEGSTTGDASIGAVQTANASSADLVFTTRNTGTRAERMRINSSGTIKGIGTYGAGSSIKIFEAERLGGAVASDWSYDDASTDMSLGTSTAHSFSLKTSDTNRLTIDSSGNVGIGCSPGVELDVAGTIRGGIANKKGTYTDGDTTPSVAGISYLRIANTGATTITDFDDAVEGQVIYLEFADSNTTVNRSNAYLSGGTNFTSSANDMLVLFYSSSTGLWLEISRSVNS